MLSDHQINQILNGFGRLRKDLLNRDSYYLILLQFFEPDTIKTVDDVIEVIKCSSSISSELRTQKGYITYKVTPDGKNVILERVADAIDSSD